MKKIFFTFLVSLVLSSCDHIGSTRVKNLIDLTPKLEADLNEKIVLSDAKKNPFSNEKADLKNEVVDEYQPQKIKLQTSI